ncbi:hypothetical protein CLAFUW4_10674 [Fulvia fulva]|nr:hypothetical protein CLAFUR4_10679 [Fulvia fulva]WPV19368.1 hypothetical protein CLAFUW4_10674 [Fulvia fulva]WPV34425.1 hypothetical protein CLAFUW7_10676 [Fulvia fulva]
MRVVSELVASLDTISRFKGGTVESGSRPSRILAVREQMFGSLWNPDGSQASGRVPTARPAEIQSLVDGTRLVAECIIAGESVEPVELSGSAARARAIGLRRGLELPSFSRGESSIRETVSSGRILNTTSRHSVSTSANAGASAIGPASRSDSQQSSFAAAVASPWLGIDTFEERVLGGRLRLQLVSGNGTASRPRASFMHGIPPSSTHDGSGTDIDQMEPPISQWAAAVSIDPPSAELPATVEVVNEAIANNEVRVLGNSREEIMAFHARRQASEDQTRMRAAARSTPWV